MRLTLLPNEALHIVASYLPCQKDVYSLIRANRHIYHALISFLYYFNSRYHHASALSFAAEHKNITGIEYLMNSLRASIGKHRSPPFQPESRDILSPGEELEDKYEDEENWIDDGRDFFLDSYWVDIATHPLYNQGCSTIDVVNVQRALFVAIDHGYENIVSVLLDNGAQVNFYRGRHRTQGPGPRFPQIRWLQIRHDPPPLFLAVKRGHTGLVRLLLERGANAELYSPSPLYRAVDDGQREIISLLLEHDVRPQASALKLAVLREDESMIRFLLNNGFNVQEYAHSALFAAKMKGDQNIVGLLESRGATLDLHSNDDEENWDMEDGDGVPKPLLRVFVSEEGAEVDESDADDDTSNVQ